MHKKIPSDELAVKRRLTTVALSAHDVDEIYQLYTLARSTIPFGFLAPRAKRDFQRLLDNTDDVIGTGIRDNAQLVAYSICHRVLTHPYPDAPLLAEIEPTKAKLYHGAGTVVHPEYQGRMLAQRLSRLRWPALAERGVDHVVGLIAVDNLLSVGNAIRAGIVLAGFSRDESCLNYIAYYGRLRNKVRTDSAPIMTNWTDHAEQGRLFEERMVVCDLSNSTQAATTRDNQRSLAFRAIEGTGENISTS